MDDDDDDGGGGAPAWVVSFADMSLLLLSFFIMLLAVSSQKLATDEDLLKILASIKVGFGYKPRNEKMDDVDLAVLQILAHRNVGHEMSQMEWKSPAIKGQREKAPDLLVKHKSGIGKPILFSKYSDKIDHHWVSEVEKIAEIVRHHFRMIVIQGHCSPEEAKDDPDGGFDLGFRRALAVKRAMVDLGIAPARLRLVSCAAHDTVKEAPDPLQRRAVVTLGTYYLPNGNEDALR